MMNQADQYLQNLLQQYQKLYREQQKELRRLPEGQLQSRRTRRRINYLRYIPGENGGKTTGITKQSQLVYDLARKKCLQKSVQLLEKNIPALEKCLKTHLAPIPDNILPLMPQYLKELPREAYLPSLRQQQAWAKEPYEASSYNLEERTHITGSGLRVRSKSEVIIADRLDFHGIPYRYEQLLWIGNRVYAPDFTIWTPSRLVYWEHCGLMADHRYRRRHHYKMMDYERAEIVPWKNLIVTYDDEFGNFNAQTIESEIVNKLCN